MKRIPSASRAWLVATGAAVALAALAGWPPAAGRPHPGDYGPDAAAATQARPAAEAQEARRPARRVWASTAMPYFSFAQSLRPQG